MDPLGLERQKTIRSLIRDEYLTCSICFNNFTSPKALPCLHTFCLDCLRDYVTGRNFEAQGMFPCPMCRKDIQIPAVGVTGFPDNHMVVGLSDTIETPPKPSVPPRPSQGAIDSAKQQHDRVSPAPYPFQPQRVSPTPHFLPPPANRGAFLPPLQPGAWGDSSKPGTSQTGSVPASPFEFVDKAGQVTGQTDSKPYHSENPGPGTDLAYPNLYPQLREDKGPCMDMVLFTFGNFGANVGDFRKPYDIAVGRNGEFVVSDHAGNRVFIFSNSGDKKCAFIAQKCFINGLAITKDNQILVCVNKSGSAIMRMYSMQGKLLKSIGEFYAYDNASGIAITPSNFVAVTNLASDNVLVFTDQFKSSVKFGRKGSGDNHFMQAQFIAATMKNYLVISDTGNHCIKVCDLEGNFKRSFGGKGDQHGNLDTPLGVATDADDNIIVADSNNFRVEIFNVKGGFYTTLVQDTNLIGPDVKPISVAVTPRNNIAVLLFGTGFAEVRVYNWKAAAATRYGMSTV